MRKATEPDRELRAPGYFSPQRKVALSACVLELYGRGYTSQARGLLARIIEAKLWQRIKERQNCR